jgi:L-fucose isomerase-like protein
VKGYKPSDFFMGFHCGNTPLSCLDFPSIQYQLIMHRLLEGEKKPDITRGTLEGQIKHGNTTIFRLQSNPNAKLSAYVAEGEIIDISPKTFGGTGVFAILEMGRFYRYGLIANGFPHHTAVAFKHTGKTIYNALKMLGVEDVYFNLPKNIYYKGENPFK